MGATAGDLVCVTGASGFLGIHIVECLLDRGFRVRATVRDADNPTKTRALRSLDHDDRLELRSADITVPGVFDDIVADVPYVVHVASSVLQTAKDPQRQIVDVAVLGTRGILAAADASNAVRRVVLTSSSSAVVDETRPHTHVFDESDWNEGATLESDPYALSKTLAEREAWRHVEPSSGYDLVAINPTMVLGPIRDHAHLGSSPSIIADLVSGAFPLVPDLTFQWVDVREVAHAHVEALVRDDASGRYLVSGHTASLHEVARILREGLGGHRAPRRSMPNAFMYIAALFDDRLSWGFLKRNLGIRRDVDNRRAVRELGVEHRSLADAVLDTARSIQALG